MSIRTFADLARWVLDRAGEWQPPDRIPETFLCPRCGTPLRNRGDAGLCHEVGFKERGGCTGWDEVTGG